MFDKRIIIIVLSAALLSMWVSVTFIDSTADLVKQLFVFKVRSNNTYDMIIAGDSRIYRGISTDPFEDNLGLSCINLGFSSGLLEPQMYQLIDKKIAIEPDRKIILLGITPHSLTHYSYPNGHIQRMNEMKSEEVIDYLYLLPIKRLFQAVNIIDLYEMVVNGKTWSDYIQIPYKRQGWIASDYYSRRPYSALESYRKTFDNRTIDSLMLDAFYVQVQEWVNRGVEVYGFIPPSSANIESLERTFSGFSDEKVIKRFISSGGKWLGIDGVYKSYDGSHMIKEDALTLSAELAEKINQFDDDVAFDSSFNYRHNYIADNFFDYRIYNFSESNVNDSTFSDGVRNIYPNEQNIPLSNIAPEYIIENNITKICFRFKVKANTLKKKLYVISQVTKDNEKIDYHNLNLSWVLKEGEWQTINYQFDVPKNLDKSSVMEVFIYNIENDLQIDDIEVFYFN